MRVTRAIIGLLLVPCCVAMSRTVFFLIGSWGASTRQMVSLPVLAVMAGVVFWMLVLCFLPKPMRTYVLAHELTHAFWGAVMGARIFGIRVSKKNGHVSLSAYNFLTALAPYFFPFYTVIVILLYYLLSMFIDLRAGYLLWLGLIGVTLGFHISFTIVALSGPQKDIQMYGRLFSYTLIYLLNMLALGTLILMISPDVTLELFVKRLMMDMSYIWDWCWSALWMGVDRVWP